MIIVDFNQTAISTLMAELAGRTDVEIRKDLIRHMIINALRSYRSKFGAEYGELVIACDNRKYWRKDKFPYYKASRKKARPRWRGATYKESDRRCRRKCPPQTSYARPRLPLP